jgi:hypothetical protein
VKIKLVISFIAAICTVIFIYACSNTQPVDKMIERKWAVDTAYGKAMDKQLAKYRAVLDTIKDSVKMNMIQKVIKANIKDQLKETIQFNIDSSIEESVIVMGKPYTLHGKWYLSNDSKKIVIGVTPQKDTIRSKSSNGGEMLSVITLGANQQSDTFNINYINTEKLILEGRDEFVWNGTMVLKPVK